MTPSINALVVGPGPLGESLKESPHIRDVVVTTMWDLTQTAHFSKESALLVVESSSTPYIGAEVDRLLHAFRAEPEVTHVGVRAVAEDRWDDPAVVKCLLSLSGRLFYCSRGPLPGSHERRFSSGRMLAGLAVWAPADLELYRDGVEGPLERLEQFPLMRLLESDRRVKALDLSSLGN